MADLVYKEDGKHCAFTDLAHYDGFYYLCFRVGDEHMFGSSHIKIMRSNSPSGTWKVYSQTATLPDIRDPKFMLGPDNRLYLLTNIINHKYGKVVGCRIGKGVVCEGYTKLSVVFNSEDMFVSSVNSQQELLCYDAVRGGRLWVMDLLDCKPRSLPAYDDATEAASFRKNIFVRRDSGKNYWIVMGVMKNETTIFETDTKIHCPAIFERLKKFYLLGRETEFVNPEDWVDVWENQCTLKLWEIKKDLSLAPIKTLVANADCGYMGYAEDLISWYSCYNRAKPDETAIYVEEF